MPTVVCADAPMLDHDALRRTLDGVADLSVVDFRETTVVEACAGADALVTDVRTPVTGEDLRSLDLAVVARAGVGVDNVDVAAGAATGTVVTRVPDYCTDEVATHHLALLLSCVRGLPRYDRSVDAGEWDWRAVRGLRRLRGQTVGVLAFGPIARRFCELVSGFDLTLVVHDPFVDAETVAAHGAELLDYDALLARSDHLSVHAPATPETRGMVDADALAALPAHAVVVNTGRGAVIDEAALAAALDADEVAAAGLDVLGEEPPAAGNPLVGHEDVLITPHAAWHSVEARRDLTGTVGHDVRAVLAEGPDADLTGRVDPDAGWL
jgi:D-3-phosphoglycerate dehydrogenase